jgi:hypothetical protein
MREIANHFRPNKCEWSTISPPCVYLFNEIANHFREVSSEGFPNQVLLGIRSGPWEGNDRAGRLESS